MTPQELKTGRDTFEQLMADSQLADAIDLLKRLAHSSAQWQLADEAERLASDYRLMLAHLAAGGNDPQRQQLLRQIRANVRRLADRIDIGARQTLESTLLFARRRELEGNTLDQLLHDYRTERNKHALLNAVDADSRNPQALLSTLRNCERCETAIFNKVWSTFPTPAADADTLCEHLADDEFPIHTKCLIVMALLLGLANYYDERKLLLLLDCYTAATHPEVAVRALVAAVLALWHHSNRAQDTDAPAHHLAAAAEQPHFADDLHFIALQLARTRNTDNVTQRMEQELMPDILKMRSDLMTKFRRSETGGTDTEADFNPEWEDMLQQSGLADKLAELNDLQEEGNDLMITTFNHLRTAAFFQTLSNWFLPFHTGHSLVNDPAHPDVGAIARVLALAQQMTDSDRYALTVATTSMPAQLREQMTTQLSGTVADHDDDNTPQRNNANVVMSVVRDLYRFFTLFPRREEFRTLMAGTLDLADCPLLAPYTGQPELNTLLAEFYLKNGFYADALRHFRRVLRQTDNADAAIFQKMGYALQCLGRTEEAIAQYERHELAADGNPWTLRHIAACHRALRHHEQALHYYRRTNEVQPGRVATLLNIGHCLLELGRPDEALQAYYEADLTDSAAQRAWRPIAWCLFVTGNDQRALQQYERIVSDSTPTWQDHLNRGHVLLCLGRTADAVAAYREALHKAPEPQTTSLHKALADDAPHLAARGIDIRLLPLLADAAQTKPQ